MDTPWFTKSVTFSTSVKFCLADFVIIVINKYCRVFDSIEIKGTLVGNQWFIYVSVDHFSFDETRFRGKFKKITFCEQSQKLLADFFKPKLCTNKDN